MTDTTSSATNVRLVEKDTKTNVALISAVAGTLVGTALRIWADGDIRASTLVGGLLSGASYCAMGYFTDKMLSFEVGNVSSTTKNVISGALFAGSVIGSYQNPMCL